MRALTLLCCLLSSGCFAYKTPRQRQREMAERYAPKVASSGGAALATACVVRVRVYAGKGYRKTHRSYANKVSQILWQASDQAAVQLGCRFKVESVKPWDRLGGDNLDSDLDALVAHDPGADVDLVIGLVAALPTATANVHDLGRARRLGHHAVMRAVDSPAEQDWIYESFGAIPEEERRELYEKRRAHKESSLFLHEWGHTQGAIHTLGQEDIMHPINSHRVRGFAPENLEVLRAALEHRLGNHTSHAWLAPVQEALQRTSPQDQRHPETRQALIEYMQRRLDRKAGADERPELSQQKDEADLLDDVAPDAVQVVTAAPSGCTLRGMRFTKAEASSLDAAIVAVQKELTDAAVKKKANTVVVSHEQIAGVFQIEAEFRLCPR